MWAKASVNSASEIGWGGADWLNHFEEIRRRKLM
jgi:hypothetical protein